MRTLKEGIELRKDVMLELKFDINKDFFIRGNTSYYMEYQLWNCYGKREDFFLYVYDPRKTKYPEDDPSDFSLNCIDRFGDNFSYGSWSSEESIIQFLKDPCDDNDEQKRIFKLMDSL